MNGIKVRKDIEYLVSLFLIYFTQSSSRPEI